MGRVNPNKAQRKRLLGANANRCCVCKRQGVGIHLHHIDEDSSNTVDENIAVLCVEDHDRHHRSGAYRPQVNHLELGPEQIRQCKKSWEAFIIEARQSNPNVVATLAAYGTVELIHSMLTAAGEGAIFAGPVWATARMFNGGEESGQS
jgi:hypothetical protein